MNIYTKEEAKIRYTLRPTPPKAHKNNARRVLTLERNLLTRRATRR